MTDSKPLVVRYTNYRGETATRHLRPEGVLFARTEFHSEPQWLMEAVDVERDVRRSFALEDMAGAREASRIIKTSTDEHLGSIRALHRAYTHTTEQQAATVALAQLWQMLDARDQTDAVMKLRGLLANAEVPG